MVTTARAYKCAYRLVSTGCNSLLVGAALTCVASSVFPSERFAAVRCSGDPGIRPLDTAEAHNGGRHKRQAQDGVYSELEAPCAGTGDLSDAPRAGSRAR